MALRMPIKYADKVQIRVLKRKGMFRQQRQTGLETYRVVALENLKITALFSDAPT